MGTVTCGYSQTMLQPDFPSSPPPPMLKNIMPEECSLSLLVFHHSCPTSSPHPSWLPPHHSCIPWTERSALPHGSFCVLAWDEALLFCSWLLMGRSNPPLSWTPLLKVSGSGPPGQYSGLLSICHCTVCQIHTYRFRLQSYYSHKHCPKSPRLWEQSKYEKFCFLSTCKICW